MSLLEQDTIKKGQVDKKVKQIDFNANNGNGKKYKVRDICNNLVYAIKSEGYL